MANSSSKRILTIWRIAGGLIVLALTLFFLNRKEPFSLPSRRGDTVQNLRVILKALQQHQLKHGQLPDRLDNVGLSSEVLKDGAGRAFIYTNLYTEKGYVAGQGEYIIVAMEEPIGHTLFSLKTQSYAIVRTKAGEFFIRSSSDPQQLRP